MAIKKTEIKLVASLLESEAEDTGVLATRIITELDGKREKDDAHWCVVYSYAGTMQVLGTFPTKNKAWEALGKVIGDDGNYPELDPDLYVRQVRSLDSIGVA